MVVVVVDEGLRGREGEDHWPRIGVTVRTPRAPGGGAAKPARGMTGAMGMTATRRRALSMLPGWAGQRGGRRWAVMAG